MLMVPMVMTNLISSAGFRTSLARWAWLWALLAGGAGCGINAQVLESVTGGAANSGGATGAGTTGGTATGGAGVTGGTSAAATGGAATGGVGIATGGAGVPTGGAATGGASSSATAPACGDPQVESRWAACSVATTESACLAAGGTWTLSFGSYCECPTGQGGCPCNKKSQCHGMCMADSSPDCTTQTQGHCSELTLVNGCQCFFWDETGLAQAVCVN